MTKKDSYTLFRKFKLSEEEFRRCWGKRDEEMCEAMTANYKLAEMTKNPKEKKKFLKEADRLHIRLGMLCEVFMSLERFRGDENYDIIRTGTKR